MGLVRPYAMANMTFWILKLGLGSIKLELSKILFSSIQNLKNWDDPGRMSKSIQNKFKIKSKTRQFFNSLNLKTTYD